jgi:HNH endonuclease
LRELLAELEPEVYRASDCAQAVVELVATINACEAAKARFAVRAALGGVHRAAGFADAGDWLASVAGSTAREARDALALVSAVESCPETRDALVAGDVSVAQAREITRTEAAVPGSEGGLLDVARGTSLGVLRDAARDQRVRAIPVEWLHAEQRRRRSIRHWRDEFGMICGRFMLTPDVGVGFVNRLDAETDRVRRAARRGGETEDREAYAADAFARMIKGQGNGRAARADFVAVCDVRAYRRGHAHEGEVCHIIGGGPIPVAVVREIAKDAFLKVAFHDGVEIKKIAHLGRRRPAELQTALELGAPPDLAGVTCCEAGCDRQYGLEWDHVDPVANQGPTSFENLAARCYPHHREKTKRDRAAGLLGGGSGGRAPP